MIANFDPTTLPNLPQSRRLAALVADLWADPNVVALWLGGSLARGQGDRYSDVDLRVALRPEAYSPDQIPESARQFISAAVTRVPLRFGGEAVVWHMMLDNGEMYDLHVQPSSEKPPYEARLVLACRDADFGEQLIGGEDRSVDFPPAVPDDIRQLVAFCWMNQQKHQKVLYRGLPLLSWQGELLMRQELVRLWFVLATGTDCGPVRRLTIHTLTPVIQALQAQMGADALALVGQPMRTEAELIAGAAKLREELARVGRLLAEKLGFDYSSAAEATVRRTWQEFRNE